MGDLRSALVACAAIGVVACTSDNRSGEDAGQPDAAYGCLQSTCTDASDTDGQVVVHDMSKAGHGDSGDLDESSSDGGVDASDPGGGSSAACAPIEGGNTLFRFGLASTGRVQSSVGHLVASSLTGQTGRWVLWDRASGRPVVEGTSAACVGAEPHLCPALAADTLATWENSTIRVLRLSSGATTNIAFDGLEFGVARDGSYVWGRWQAQLKAWSLDGHEIRTVTGDFRSAEIFGDIGSLLVGRPGSPDASIDVIGLPEGAIQSHAHQGTFAGWFDDGTRFLTKAGQLVRVYSKSGQLDDLLMVQGEPDAVHGSVNRVVVQIPNRGIDIFTIHGNGVPAKTVDWNSGSKVVVGHGRMFRFGGDDLSEIDSVDLASDDLTETRTTTEWPRLSAGAVSPDGHIVIGNEHGVVFTMRDPARGPTRTFGCGAVVGMAGAENGTLAVSTSVGQLLVIDVNRSPAALKNVVAWRAGALAMTEDGSIIGAMADSSFRLSGQDLTLKFFDGNTLRELRSVPSKQGDPAGTRFEFSLARRSSKYVDALCTFEGVSWTCKRTLGDLAREGGDKPIAPAFTSAGVARLSRDGSKLMVSPGWGDIDSPTNATAPKAYFYEEGMVRGSTDGVAVCWAGDVAALVGRAIGTRLGYGLDKNVLVDVAGAEIRRTGIGMAANCILNEGTGLLLAVGPRDIAGPQAVDRVYRFGEDVPVWESPSTNASALVGRAVWYVDDATGEVKRAPIP